MGLPTMVGGHRLRPQPLIQAVMLPPLLVVRLGEQQRAADANKTVAGKTLAGLRFTLCLACCGAAGRAGRAM